MSRYAGRAWRSARSIDNPLLRVLALLTVGWWTAILAAVAVAVYIAILPLRIIVWILRMLLDDGWSKWPTLEQYWAKYPNCRTNRGTRCHYCGSGNIWQYGWSKRSDERRIHRCNQCQRTLYRT